MDAVIVCEECGSVNEPAARFCGNCSSYLAWTDPTAAPTGEPGPAAHAASGESGPADASAAETPVAQQAPVAEVAPEPQGAPELAEPQPTPPRGEAADDVPAVTGPIPAGSTPVGPTPVGSTPTGSTPTGSTPTGSTPTGPTPTGPTPAGPAPDPQEPSRDQAAVEESTRRAAAAAAMLKPVKPGAGVGAGPTPAVPAPAMDTTSPGSAAPARKPQARKPGEAEPRRTPPPKPDDEPEVQPGDQICGNCGAGNAATRKFCRRCGDSLEQAVVVAPPPWYRRIFLRRAKTAKAAGSRPTKLHSDSQRAALRVRRVLAILVGVGVVSAAVWFLRPQVGGLIDSVQDRTSDSVQVTPSEAKATSSVRGHGAGRTRDGQSNTYWEAGEQGQASGVSLNYVFDEPFRLVNLLMIPGASKDQAEFLTHGRPADVRVTLTTSTGEEVEKTWQIPNQPGDSVLDVGVDDVEQVRLTIASSYVDEGQRVAIAEVEFRTRG